MTKSKYEISGIIKKRGSFKIEVDAETESYAKKLALSKVGSTQKVRETMIVVKSIKKI